MLELRPARVSALLGQDMDAPQIAALLERLEEGVIIKGVVKNLTDYGAFVDLGGIDGLLHITDMAWKRVKHPSEVVNVGDEVVWENRGINEHDVLPYYGQ